MLRLLRQLLDRSRKRNHGATIKGVLVFYHDNRWADAAWGREPRAAVPAELPPGLIEQADRQLKLAGRLVLVMQDATPRIEPVDNLNQSHLRQRVRQHYPNEHVYFWQQKLSCGTFVLAIIGLRPIGVPL